MTAVQRKAVFGLSKKLGMNNDELHCLVYGVTGCESLKELTDKQAEEVIRELDSRRNIRNRNVSPEERDPKAYKPAQPGMMTTDQQSKAWKLMYRLRDLDKNPRLHEDGKPYTIGERMAGAIYKITGNNMAEPGPEIFSHVHFDEGEELIEGLKRYVRSAERKAAKGVGNGGK